MNPHVLVARQDNNGDVLLTGPAVRAVAARARRLTYLCGPRGEPAARLLPGVDEVIVQSAAWIEPHPQPITGGAIDSYVRTLAALAVDEAFICTSFHQSPLPLALLLRMAGVAFVAATSVDYAGSLLDVRHAVGDDVHEVERSLSLVATRDYMLPPQDDGRLAVLATASQRNGIHLSRPYVVVHPGCTVSARAWAPERNAALVQALARKGVRVVVTGSEAERDLTAYVAGEKREGVFDFGGRTDFAGLGLLLARAEAVVVGNTGTAHLAAAVGTPIVSLFPPTVPAARFRPWKVPHVLLGRQDIVCAGCRARVCPIPGHPCIDSVTVADVQGALGFLRAQATENAGGKRACAP